MTYVVSRSLYPSVFFTKTVVVSVGVITTGVPPPPTVGQLWPRAH